MGMFIQKCTSSNSLIGAMILHAPKEPECLHRVPVSHSKNIGEEVTKRETTWACYLNRPPPASEWGEKWVKEGEKQNMPEYNTK